VDEVEPAVADGGGSGQDADLGGEAVDKFGHGLVNDALSMRSGT
jgi:hypothetical protein